MEEVIKIYRARNSLDSITNVTGEERERYFRNLAWQQTNAGANVRSMAYLAKRQNRKETRMDTLNRIIAEKEQKTRELQETYPWFPLLTNWVIAGLIILLCFSFIWWGLSVSARTKASAEYDQAVEAFYSERQAEEEAAQKAAEEAAQSEAALRERDIYMMSKFIAGIQGFVENKDYTDVDLETYAQCPVNRVLNPAFSCTTIEEALSQEGQWVGYSALNHPTMKHRQIAEKIVNRLYDGEPQPCSNSYCWTEFTDKGLYLKSDFGPASFNNTWRAGA